MKKKALLIITVALLTLTLAGCADVNYRFTRLYEGGYRQTLTVTLNPEEISRTTSYSVDKIKDVLILCLRTEGYTVTENGYTVTAEKDYKSMEEVNASLLGIGFAVAEDGTGNIIGESIRLTDYKVDKGLFFTTTVRTGRSVFYLYDNYVFLYFGYYNGYGLDAVFNASHLDITYQYATVYKSVQSAAGVGIKEGKYYVNTYAVDGENPDITIVTKTPNTYAWYAFDLLLTGMFIAIMTVIVKTTNAKKKLGGEFYGGTDREKTNGE